MDRTEYENKEEWTGQNMNIDDWTGLCINKEWTGLCLNKDELTRLNMNKDEWTGLCMNIKTTEQDYVWI